MPRAAPHPIEETFDQWLVVRAQAGDEDALRRLVSRWSLRIQRHALRLTGDADAAADVSQESWVAIVRNLRRLEDPACFRRWAYRIVGNKSADWVRRQQSQRTRTTPMSEEPLAPPRDNGAEEQTEAVHGALAQLPEKDRAILAMHYSEEMPLSEIADALGTPLGTVKSRLYHARQRLKETLTQPKYSAT